MHNPADSPVPTDDSPPGKDPVVLALHFTTLLLLLTVQARTLRSLMFALSAARSQSAWSRVRSLSRHGGGRRSLITRHPIHNS
ncbi:hypothetical protein [Streptomyces rectiverticillatus]|uniref:hypothetical protein n=1 Tax=Streptomyces rectiverticillatus TaxID=173860 RepID=UPI0015C2CB9A|nr:hypothetical protein [Streptomyces rectiverticillatus]